MRFGVNSFIWSDHFDRTQTPLFTRLRDAGFDGIELPLVDPQQARDPEVCRVLRDSGLECTFCSVLPPGLNTIDDDDAVRDRTRRHFEECIRTAADMGGSIIAGPLYAPVGYLPGRRRTDEEWKRAVDCFQQLGPALQDCGVSLAIEPLNRYETYFLNTVQDAVDLCKAIGHPGVGILFDTYHANIEEKHAADAIRQAGSLLRHVHACENDRGVPGSGHVPWDDVFTALRAVAYDGWLVIESFGFTLGALSAAASIWRDLAHSPEEIAFEGLPFLRREGHAATAG